jgi:hypothetical protein
MKWFFESCILAAGIAFVGWVIITAGLKFEVKIKGEEYGFTVGGMNEQQKYITNKLAMYNSYPKDPAIPLELAMMEYLSKEKFDDMFDNFYKQFKSYDVYLIKDSVTGKNIDLLILVWHKGNPLKKIISFPDTTYTII